MRILPEPERRKCEHQYLGWNGYVRCRFTGNTPLCWYEEPECVLDVRKDKQKIKYCVFCGQQIVYINRRRGTSDSPYPIDLDGEVIAINDEINRKMRTRSLCEKCLMEWKK